MLWRAAALPLGTIGLFEYATERMFLRPVGGSYIFVHRLLQDYFAVHEATTWSAGLTSTSAGEVVAIRAEPGLRTGFLKQGL